MLDVAAVRARFPALASSSSAFLDGPAGSQVPAAVADAMRDQLLAGTANDGGAFATSVAANALMGAPATRRPSSRRPTPPRSRSGRT